MMTANGRAHAELNLRAWGRGALTRTLRASIILLALVGFALEAFCGTPPVTQLVDRPFEEVGAVPPVVMLTMSRDHQYFFRAYDDYTDLNPEDGKKQIEYTYEDYIEYYGYFHPRRCYAYRNARFEQVGATGASRNSSGTHYCYATRGWSGNFLNWATMTRVDIVRKTLYGGFRRTDTTTATVLERASLPTDAHAFTKYYNKPDVVDLVPAAYEGVIISGDDPAIDGPDPDISGPNEGITLCNVTQPTNENFAFGQAMPERPARPPLMRAVRGNFQLWAANEGRQCTWQESGAEAGIQSNGNVAAQSGLQARTSDPGNGRALRTDGTTAILDATTTRDHVVRILSCDVAPEDAATNFENCKAYGNYFKPEGLLQRYGMGTGERIRFGLMTGSYVKNKSGGVLRKAVGAMEDEVSPTTGLFRTPVTAATPGIIRTLNALQIYGYDSGTQFPYQATCGFNLQFPEGNCASWGNPVSEVYQESLRYLSLEDDRFPNPAFRNTQQPDSGLITGINEDTNWATDPLESGRHCGSSNIVVVNSSISSFEDDGQTASVALNTLVNGKTLTDAVGSAEGFDGGSFFIGRSNSTDKRAICTSKSLAKFGDALGICPEGPTLAGSFHIAGLAAHAHTEDLRPGDGFPGEQRIDTYALSLSTNSPVVTIPVGSQTVTLIPAYRLLTDNDTKTEDQMTRQGGGALVDFRVVLPPTEVAPPSSPSGTPGTTAQPGSKYTRAIFYANWEDREQGADYDQDVWGIIEYRLDARGSSSPRLEIRTNTVAESTQGKHLFGFVINGTTQDGFHAFSGVRGANFTDGTGVPGCTNCRASEEGSPGQKGFRSHVFSPSSASSTQLLKPPLFYAAKWGGFTDTNDNDKPDLRIEWDTRDANGNFLEGGDGVPDNYFVVTNPGAMESALSRVFNAILARVSSGTAAAASTSGRSGTGLLAQASYESVRRDTVDPPSEITWIGNVFGLWIDRDGLLREEGNPAADGSASLGGYRSDPRVDIFYDQGERRTRIRRYIAATEDSLTGADTFIDELSSLSPLWDARQQLAALENATIPVNRDYESAPANEGRYVFTFIDADGDGMVDGGAGTSAQNTEQKAFVSDSFGGVNAEWLTPASSLTGSQRNTWVSQIVNWTRGQELSGLRSRLIDLNNDGEKEVVRLGDILHSSPEVVAAPGEGYGNVISENTAVKTLAASYRSFREKYKTRRHVVYVGANDGMLHAFNAGFYDDTSKSYRTTPTSSTQGSSGLAHPLGSELWAFVPKNVLPHLKFLSDPAYAHLYYVDGSPQSYDVRIFPDDATHPSGWGTILVVPLGFGGGADEFLTTVDIQGDGNAANDVKTRSSIVILDVTDPEQPPRLLAELSPDNLQYTISDPHPVLVRNGPDDAWFLVAGSGPSTRSSANYDSTATGRAAELMVFDLVELVAGSTGALTPVRVPIGNDAFAGDLIAGDFDFDLNTDALYFGTVGKVGSDGAPALGVDGNPIAQGGLFRMNLNRSRDPTAWGEATGGPLPLVSGIDLPFAKAPTLGLDGAGNRWVIAASGRYEARPDRDSGSRQRQALVGIIDPPRTAALPFADPGLSGGQTVQGLLDVTDALVFGDGSIDLDGPSADGKIEPQHSHLSLRAAVERAGGWKRWFSTPATTGTQLAERGVSGILSIGTTLLLPAFTPDTAACVTEGKSTLLGLALETGVPPERGVFGTVPCPQCRQAESLADLVPPSPPASIEPLDNPADFTAIQYEGRLEATSLVGQTGGLRSGSAADGGFSARLCAQSSTASLQCENIRLKDRIASQEISWRQRRR